MRYRYESNDRNQIIDTTTGEFIDVSTTRSRNQYVPAVSALNAAYEQGAKDGYEKRVKEEMLR